MAAKTSLKQVTNTMNDHQDRRAVHGTTAALLADITALRAAIVAITAKLDADAGVTDADYATSCNPAGLTTIS